MISLQVNGRRVEMAAPMTVLAYLEQMAVNPRSVAVEVDGVILDREMYSTTTLGAGAEVEIVRMVGGG